MGISFHSLVIREYRVNERTKSPLNALLMHVQCEGRLLWKEVSVGERQEQAQEQAHRERRAGGRRCFAVP